MENKPELPKVKPTLIESVLNATGVTGILIMTLLVTADVLLRYFFNKPIPGAYEVCELLLVAVVFLGLAYTQAKGANISIDILTMRFPAKHQNALNALGSVFGLAFATMITWLGIFLSIEAFQIWERTQGLVRIPLFPPKVLMALGGFLLALRFGRELFEQCRMLIGGNGHE